jgi:hypothetical protein
MDSRSIRQRRLRTKPQYSFFRPTCDLGLLERMRKPVCALGDYQEIRLSKADWEELLDLFRAHSAILKILETRGCDPNSGARELLRMSLQSYQLLLERLIRASGNASF